MTISHFPFKVIPIVLFTNDRWNPTMIKDDWEWLKRLTFLTTRPTTNYTTILKVKSPTKKDKTTRINPFSLF